MAGAPIGNKNGAGKRYWSDAVRKAIIQGKSLEPLAKVLIAKAMDGDIAALREIGDRLEGKPAQVQIIQGDEDGGAVRVDSSLTPSEAYLKLIKGQ